MSQSSRRPSDPLRASLFRVEIDGIITASFRSCSGLRVESEVFEYAEGGFNQGARKLPGPAKVSNIVLRRGLINSGELWEWWDSYLRGDKKVSRRSGSIIVCDDNQSELLRWNFHQAWPVKWEGPDLDGRSAEGALETLEIAPERLERA